MEDKHNKKGAGTVPVNEAVDSLPFDAAEPVPIDEKAEISTAMNKLPTWRYWTIAIIAVAYLLFQIYVKLVYPLDRWIQVPLHLFVGIIVAFLFKPLAKKESQKWLWIIDFAFIGLSLVCIWYFMTNVDYLNYRILSVDQMTTMDSFVAYATLLLVMEAVRRTLGKTLFFVILFFIVYAFAGQLLSGTFKFAGMNWKQFGEMLIMGLNGIFGSPLAISASTLFYFMVFGSVFATTGGGQVLIDLGMKTSNRTVGGAAKASVISSGLMGMISGSAVANVTTTGVLTIPLMKRTGYTPEEAGAVESVASTGGQIMPPIMGAGAFIMAEMLGVSYSEVATRALIPALAYYFSIFCVVHLLAKKRDLKKTESAAIHTPPILPRLYRLIPMFVVVVMIFMGTSLPRAALLGTALSLIIGLFSKETRLSIKELISVLMDGTRQAVSIAIPTAACGIMIGVVVRSGVAVKIAKLIALWGNSSVFVALLIAAAGCLMLGMALPTVAAYLISNVLFVPSIRELLISTMGFDPMLAAFVANMFIFYFGVIAQITPPVCLASFTAAGIAGGSSWKTGWKAFAYATVAFMAPFIFVYDPAILQYGSVWQIAYATSVVGAGSYLLATAYTGYQFGALSMVERVVILAAALMLIIPEPITDYIGLAIGGSMFLINYLRFAAKKKNKTAAA